MADGEVIRVGRNHADATVALRQDQFGCVAGSGVVVDQHACKPMDGKVLRQAQYLILSENWYATAFANELNGPLTGVPGRLIKTKPEYARFYRDVLGGRHPLLTAERAIELSNFMPELMLHRALYGSFQLFVGDIDYRTA